jgi:hypothetical protein
MFNKSGSGYCHLLDQSKTFKRNLSKEIDFLQFCSKNLRKIVRNDLRGQEGRRLGTPGGGRRVRGVSD